MTGFQEYFGRLKPRLDEAFRRALRTLLGDTVTDELASLRATLEGGKKVRGCLVCMVSEALGGDRQAAMPRAVAVELIQTATLIHDDFVDQDTVRRNRPATWTLHGARKAVLIGDVIFSAAIKMMNDLSRKDGQVILRTITQVARGAFLEPLKASRLVRELRSSHWKDGLYDRIIRLKTGSLFGAACQLGAISAKAGPRLEQRASSYGTRVGEAYQIADDLYDVEQCLKMGSMDRDRMVILAPMLVYFVGEMKHHILNALEGRPLDPDGPVLGHLRKAARLMAEEIQDRIGAALSEIDGVFPINEHAELIRRAPQEMTKMILAH